MDPGQTEYYEFLDLTDIDDNERFQLNNTLFPSEQSSHDLTDSGVWNEATFVKDDRLGILFPAPVIPMYLNSCPQNVAHGVVPFFMTESDHLSTLNSGSSVAPSESDFSMNGDHHAISPQFGAGSQCPPPQATNALYAAGGPTSPYNMNQQPGVPPSHMYHMMQPTPLSNVYVGNVTANVNVHGYMGHYVPYIAPGPVDQAPEISAQRSLHAREYNPRGRRGRGGHNKREYQSPRSQQQQQQQQQQQIQQDLVEAQHHQAAAYQQYMSMPYQSTYYHHAPTPQSHLAQHTTGSPLYVGQHMPMYAPLPPLYQYHPGMLYSPMSLPPEYQLIEPSGKIENNEMEMYGQTAEMTQQMMGMNIQSEDVYNCLPSAVSHPGANDYGMMAHNGAMILEECPQENVTPITFTESEKVEELPFVENNAEEVSIVKSIEIEVENSSVIQLPPSIVKTSNEEQIDESISHTNEPSLPVVAVPSSDPPKNEQTAPVAVPISKIKGPFVNNKDIVKTGPGRKSSLKHPLNNQGKMPQLNQPVEKVSDSSESVPQPPEILKLQSDNKSIDNRPKSQTPPNSVWVNNQLYTPPVNDIPENAILVQNLPSKITAMQNSEQKPKPEESSDLKIKDTTPTTEIAAAPAINTFTKPLETSNVSAPPNKSWASLFNNKPSMNTETVSVPVSIPSVTAPAPLNNTTKPMAVVQPMESVPVPPSTTTQNIPPKVEKNWEKDRQTAAMNSTFLDDPNSYRAGEFLAKYNLDNRTVSLQPRGLTNRSNYCYINSTLQALLACPPLYNLLKALPYQIKRGKSSTPIIDAMVQLAHEFSPLPAGARVGRREKGQQRRDELPDVSTGPAFEPLVIHRMLNGIHPNTFQVEGRQEDAEEFLGCLLNGLNDEMVELMKLVEEPEEKPEALNGELLNGDAHNEDDDDWKVMGPKNKGSITRRSHFCRSPISDIFRGQLRSRVQRAGDLTTDSVQPFFTLQLDIEKAASVTNALELLVGRDQLEGVTCSKTNQEVEAWQQVSLEELPVVLILHLKWFDYKLDGCTKIVKNVEFPIDLKIDSKIMSSKIKYTAKQRQYKLFAVVYHDGKEASKGHYITDVFHVGFNGWIRYDDSVVKAVTENMVLHPRQPRVPYLLYYRRCDTIGQPGNSTTRVH